MEFKKINSKQKYKNQTFSFDPDSSPDAWEFYNKIYSKDHWPEIETYEICTPTFFTYYKATGKQGKKSISTGEWYNYLDISSTSGYNRLYAIAKDQIPIYNRRTRIKYYKACSRLSGEVDFNFNHKHSPFFEKLLLSENRALNNLEHCKEMHHNLLNFSLMQTMGNLQGFKGIFCDDRLDRFLFFLDKYYKLDLSKRNHSPIIKNAGLNSCSLMDYLSNFNDAYDYCNKIYFIDEKLLNKLLINGEKEINTADDVERYLSLACEYWETKASKIYS